MAYVVLDFETTGLDYLTEQVIEIGAIKLDKDFNEIGSLHTMVRLTEGKELSQFIQDYTGIKEEALYDGLPEAVALNMLKDFIGNSVVVAQHAPFDLSFLAKAVEPELFIDTRSISRLLNPDEKAGLKDLVERYGVELNGHHRSMNDVKATIEVFKIMMNETLQRGLPVYNVIVKAPDRDLPFIPLSAVVIGLDAYKENLRKAEEAKAASEETE
jgi:DNA polymerase III subunit epsilon